MCRTSNMFQHSFVFFLRILFQKSAMLCFELFSPFNHMVFDKSFDLHRFYLLVRTSSSQRIRCCFRLGRVRSSFGACECFLTSSRTCIKPNVENCAFVSPSSQFAQQNQSFNAARVIRRDKSIASAGNRVSSAARSTGLGYFHTFSKVSFDEREHVAIANLPQTSLERRASGEGPSSTALAPCRSFSGLSRSEVTCATCSHRTTKWPVFLR